MDDSFFSRENERIQRALNDLKRKELQEKYGMISQRGMSKLPPEIESEWLDYIAEFERQSSAKNMIVMRMRIGNPDLSPVADIPNDEIHERYEKLVTLLLDNNIVVEFSDAVDERERYRLITEELLDEEMEDIRIPGMVAHFIHDSAHKEESSLITRVNWN